MDAAKRKAILETLKSAGRGLWFGILGLVVVALTAIVSSGNISDMGVSIYGFTVNYSVIILAVAAYVIKLLDTYIHNNQNIDSHGLAPAFLQGSTSTPDVVQVLPPTVVQPTQPVEAAQPAEQAQPVEQPQAPETPLAQPLPQQQSVQAPTVNQPLGS